MIIGSLHISADFYVSIFISNIQMWAVDKFKSSFWTDDKINAAKYSYTCRTYMHSSIKREFNQQ